MAEKLAWQGWSQERILLEDWTDIIEDEDELRKKLIEKWQPAVMYSVIKDYSTLVFDFRFVEYEGIIARGFENQ